MDFLRLILFLLTHRACPVCRGGALHVEGGECCMCGGDGVVPLGHEEPREVL